jgi:hypothetical protein
MKSSLLALALLLPALTHGTTLRHDIAARALWVSDGALKNSDIRRIETLLDVHPEIHTLHFRDIQGGNSLLVRIVLDESLRSRAVEVHGRCAGACAIAALTSRAPVLHRDATLTIREQWGFYRYVATTAHRDELTALLALRLPTVPHALLEGAVNRLWPHDRELVLRPAGDGSASIDVTHCEPAPTRCVHVTTLRPGDSAMKVAPRAP